MCIKYAGDEKALLRLRELTGCPDISDDTFAAIEEYLDAPELLEYRKGKEEGGRIDMRSRFRELMENIREEGMEQGIEQAKKTFQLADEGLQPEEIARRLSIPEEKVMQILK